MELFHIDIGYACYGVTCRDGIVTDAPPIAKWMIGKKWVDVEKWLLNKKAIIT